jgi:hypothetical protein
MAVLLHLARHRLAIAVVVLSGVLVIAGCGSSSKPKSASKGTTTSGTASTSATTSSSASNSATTSSASTNATTSSRARKRSPAAYADSQLAAAKCIRSHGFPNFPDPTFGAGGAQVNLSTNINMSSPGFQLAQKECAKLGVALAGYAPVSTATAVEMAEALAISRCMRAHGVPNWPDPTKTLPSNLNGDGVQGAVPGPPGGPIFVIPKSIDIEAPVVRQAAIACHNT